MLILRCTEMDNYELPPSFSPDNSPEARTRRMAQHLIPKVIEIPKQMHRVTQDDFIAYDNAMAYINNVIEVEFRKDEPPQMAA